MDDGGDLDAMFGSFLNQVNNLKTKKMKNIEANAGTPEEIIERLTERTLDSAFQILQLSPEASDSEITKQYRKMSVLIHPDKCKHEKAAEAFQLLAKAYADTKDPNYKDKYKEVVLQARENVKKRIEKENKDRAKRGEDQRDTQGNDFDRDVLAECERLTNDGKEQKEHKNEVLEANLKRMAAAAKEAKQRRREEDQEKRSWERQRDKRVAGWQIFMNNVESKRFKTESWAKVGAVGSADRHHTREERTSQDPKVEIDREDVKVRRSATQAGAVGIDQTYKKAWR
mmetsp:Transcript_10694/g.29725  ORF Transcript_10694/g.29725 Transcript_10694/m.29725 type:complete len:285 (-) Transcript_10694:197-1051(-)